MHQIKRTGKRLLQKHNTTCPSEWICEREGVSGEDWDTEEVRENEEERLTEKREECDVLLTSASRLTVRAFHASLINPLLIVKSPANGKATENTIIITPKTARMLPANAANSANKWHTQNRIVTKERSNILRKLYISITINHIISCLAGTELPGRMQYEISHLYSRFFCLFLFYILSVTASVSSG